ncbi:TPA: resolvase, partial [Escherichia coli]|nr:resolvase [Escherichia coli]HAX2762313.1 resolvase [Escherichia coli]
MNHQIKVIKLVLLTESKKLSTDAQDLERQEAITTAAKAAGYYVAGIYREKASGA